MLKFLIALGGKDVPEDQVIDTLWPESDGDMAHFSFKTNLHRLRQLVGNENVVRLIEGRLTLDPRYCWVDVDAFQDLSSRIKDAEGRAER
jgi:DNA-binding SARP family transcriptional activator